MKEKIDFEIKDVAKFYSGRSIFLTGGTGFIGKVLIEKLLRSCPGIDKLYLLIRPKKNLTIEERVDKLFTDELFNKLKAANPTARDKIIPVLGDTMEKDLGISLADKQVLIDNVSIVIHNAACVRFDDDLRHAILSNVRSTMYMCILAESMKKLVSFLHISSSYAHCDKCIVEEIPYPAKVDWREAIKIAENVDSHLLNILTAKFIGTVPNTYVFSKSIAENVISYYSDRLPCSICRPSIVVSTISEPEIGWISNFNGPVGLMIGGGKGLVRIVYSLPDNKMDNVPVDYVVKLFLLAIYVRGNTTVEQNPTAMIYNLSADNFERITVQFLCDFAKRVNNVRPLSNPLWYPAPTLTSSFVYYYINFLMSDLALAIILDTVLKLIGRKPMLVKLQRTIYTSNVSLAYFLFNKWTFKNKKALMLLNSVSPLDKADFWFDGNKVNIKTSLPIAIEGAKRFLMHEDMNRIERDKYELNRAWIISVITRIILFSLFFWFVSSMMGWI